MSPRGVLKGRCAIQHNGVRRGYVTALELKKKSRELKRVLFASGVSRRLWRGRESLGSTNPTRLDPEQSGVGCRPRQIQVLQIPGQLPLCHC
ncbi:hypothetical protein AGOR_G00012380 [Albula goreensis]|uniref:Uncharacterized protein n=1 Tax=Albula goreensis TaxID=1534307 RepID=A0A8T3E7P6_9TELE|nr:hypothetical protein AGOR_G00012380 [Albula goreensis]